jgi:hypothetical protein
MSNMICIFNDRSAFVYDAEKLTGFCLTRKGVEVEMLFRDNLERQQFCLKCLRSGGRFYSDTNRTHDKIMESMSIQNQKCEFQIVEGISLVVLIVGVFLSFFLL